MTHLLSSVKIVCKVYDDYRAPETHESYTLENTAFYFSLSWSPNFTDRNFYSNNYVIWDFGDNTIFTGSSAKHYYKFPNTYNVGATIFDKNGESYNLTLENTLTAKNIFPDYIYLHPLNPNGKAYNLPTGKASNQIIVTRYNSWQNEDFLKKNDYTINLYVSGSKSDHLTLSSYYTNKYSHLRAFHGFVSVSVNSDNFLQSKVVESTKTNSVSVYAIPYTTGYIDNNWKMDFNFYSSYVDGSCFIGSSGSNKELDNIYFVDQKQSDFNQKSVDIIYASFNSKEFNDNYILNNNADNFFQNYDEGYFNLPWSAQTVRSIFNPASSIRITSNGISIEGSNKTVGTLSAQSVYPFDIYPIKWKNTNIPFVLNLKDNEDYSVKAYEPIYNFHTGKFNEELYDVNLKLIKYVDLDPLQEYVNVSAYELKDAVFTKNESVPRYNDSPYFAGKVSLPYEAKTVAISATVKIQDIPVPKIYPIYGFLSQIGVSKIKRYQKLNVYNYCDTEELEFFFKPSLYTFTDTTTANFHVSYCPLNYIDENKENRVFILDADNDKIYRTDVDGNSISIIDLKDMDYLDNSGALRSNISFLNHNNTASPMWSTTDRFGNLYVSLTDAISVIKINYETDTVSVVYLPPFSSENLELFDIDLYREKGKNISKISSGFIDTKTIEQKYDIRTIQKYPQYFGFVGENTIIPSCVDVDLDHNVYVAYTHPLSNFVCKYANNGELLDIIYFNYLEVPQEIIVDNTNNLWVGVENINESSFLNYDREDYVYHINTETLEKTKIRGIEGFGMMSIDAEQNLYVLHKTDTISKIDFTTKTKKDYIFSKGTIRYEYLKDIGGIAVDSSGELWVVNNVDGKIYFADTKNMSTPLSALPSVKLKDFQLKTLQDLQSVYFVTGDWTGFRWINKFIKTENPQPRTIQGLSTYFDILEPKPAIAKKGENLDASLQFKSYVQQESLFDKRILLDDFIGQIIGKNENIDEIGKIIYEKITNFVENNSDIDTCNIQQLISYAESTGVELNKYLYSYPPSVRRSLDLLSIGQKKIFGSPNVYNRNFALSSIRYLKNNNLGSEINIESGKFIAGYPIVTFELFSENFNLVTNTIVEGYKNGDIIPLSSVNYNWGWGLVTATKEQSGSEIKQYYKFYNYIPNKELDIYDNMIDFDSDFTTITPQQTSFKDWSKFGGQMDKSLSYSLYRGLKLI